MIKIVNTLNTFTPTFPEIECIREWDRYVNTCPSATIYHLPEWSDVLEKSFGYRPFHLMAVDGDGKLCGILPLLLIRSALTGKRLVSLPFSYLCGPITTSSEAMSSLMDEAKKLVDSLKCSYLEIKVIKDYGPDFPWEQKGFTGDEQFSTFVLDLSQFDKVWKNLDAKSVRWAIGKARRDGVTVRRGISVQDIRSFSNLNLKTKRRIGVPGHPESLFLNMFEKMGDRCALYMAELKGEFIAGIITMQSHDTVLYGYGASDDKFRIHQPNSLLVWTAIEEAAKNGYRYFDFGRTSPAEQNLVSFKKHWGTKELSLSYYYYPHAPNSLALNNTGIRYRLATSLWRRTPLTLAGWGSDFLFKHLG